MRAAWIRYFPYSVSMTKYPWIGKTLGMARTGIKLFGSPLVQISSVLPLDMGKPLGQLYNKAITFITLLQIAYGFKTISLLLLCDFILATS